MYTQRFGFHFALFLLCITCDVYAQKTDKITLSNGDLITGEIKKLDYGKVSFKTAAAGTINIKWEQVYRMRSDKTFEIWLSKGVSYHGSLDTTNKIFEVRVISKDSSWVINMNRIVEFSQLKSRFWTRLDGNINVGYQYTKGSKVTQFNSSYFIEYKAANSLIQSSGTAILTNQPERADSRKQDVSVNYQYMLWKNLSTIVFTKAQQNTELGMNMRLSLGGGFSKAWIKSNSQRLSTSLGVLVNREETTAEKDVTVNTEGIIQLEYRAFRYRDPEMDMRVTYDLLPSFTVDGRYRSDLEANISFEIFSDFFLGLNFYYNQDTKPANETSENNDWGVVTSIGYTF